MFSTGIIWRCSLWVVLKETRCMGVSMKLKVGGSYDSKAGNLVTRASPSVSLQMYSIAEQLNDCLVFLSCLVHAFVSNVQSKAGSR